LYLLDVLFYSKFYPVFSFLFGIGITLQYLRQKEKNNVSWLFYLRRFSALFVLGAAHIVFIWSGDILHIYAVLGLLLILVIPRSNKLIIAVAVLVLLFPYYRDVFGFVMEKLELNYAAPLESYAREDLILIYRTGTYSDILQVRLKEYAYAVGLSYSHIAPFAFFMMLLGVLVVKKGILQNLEVYINRYKIGMWLAGLLSMGYHAFIVYVLFPKYGPDINPLLGKVLTLLFFVSDFVVSLFYLLVLGQLFTTSFGRKLIKPMRHAGKMALSNYLFQSVAGLFVFSSLGLAWYETLSPFAAMAAVLIIYSLQLMLSKLWLRTFAYGPVEWVWRCVSYQKWLTITRIKDQEEAIMS
jgi:uncharacterized protein